MNQVLKLFLGILTMVCYFSCRKDTPLQTEAEILRKYLKLPTSPYNYAALPLPTFFNNQFVKIQNNTPANNITTDWGATLGRVLFYDKRLSKNHTIACASCHQQQFGFSDTAQFSLGFLGGFTKRHSMSLINAAYYVNGRFFWDERASSLEEQVLMPVQDAVEMGMTLDSLVSRLQHTEFYPILFKYAFGSSIITLENVSKALAQFVRSMVSYQSKYDEGLAKASNRNVDFPNFNTEENQGKGIFMNNPKVNCSGCHNTDVFILDNARNNSLSGTNTDLGIFVHTKNPLDIGKFKTPSLKNVAERHRYMHNGSVVGLEAVINHYNVGIQANPTIDPHLKDGNGNPVQMNLTSSEINALKAFLVTLSDKKIMTDEKFSSPF